MKKIFIIGSAILLVLVILLGYLAYKNKVSVNYSQVYYKTPDDFGPWQKTELQNGSQVYQNPDDKAVIMFAQIVPQENNFQIDNWKKAIKKDKEQCEKLDAIKINKFKANSYEASEYVSECTKNSNIYKMRNVMIVNNNDVFQAGLSAPKNDYDKNNIIFEKIINSVAWK